MENQPLYREHKVTEILLLKELHRKGFRLDKCRHLAKAIINILSPNQRFTDLELSEISSTINNVINSK